MLTGSRIDRLLRPLPQRRDFSWSAHPRREPSAPFVNTAIAPTTAITATATPSLKRRLSDSSLSSPCKRPKGIFTGPRMHAVSDSFHTSATSLSPQPPSVASWGSPELITPLTEYVGASCFTPDPDLVSCGEWLASITDGYVVPRE